MSENVLKLYNASITTQAADDQNLNTFEIVANAGSLMDFGAECVVLDINDATRVSCHTSKPPLLVDHDYTRPIGHIEAVEIKNGTVCCRGVFSIDTPETERIKSSLKNGFPWQASLGFTVNAGYKYRAGDTAKTSNGTNYKCTKKTTVTNDFTIWECSVVLFGADNKTDVKINAAEGVIGKGQNVDKQNDNTVVDKIDNTDGQKLNAQHVDVEGMKKAALAKVREAEQKEIERIAKIKDVAAKYEASAERIAQAINSGETVEAFELDVLRASYGKPPKPTKQDNGGDDKTIEAVAVMAAGYNASKYGEQIVERAERLKGRDFRDVFEALTGFKPTYEQQKNADLWTAAASTYNLGSILTNCANAILLQAFEDQDSTWRDVFKVSSVSNFKIAERYRIGSEYEFKKLANGATMEHGELSDEKYEIRADVYGRQGELTYQDIVNGDALDVFGDIMRRFAWGAARAIQKACWSLFLNPAADTAGNAFFSAAHGNKATGKPLTAAALAEQTAAYITRKRGFGADADELLGLRPELLIVPPSLKYTADLITKATTYSPASSTISNYNPHAAYNWRVVCPAELEDSTFGGGYSASTWYLANNPSKLAAFEIVFLNGQQALTLRQNDVEIGRLGIKFDGHVDFGVGQQDYRGIYQVTAN